MDAFTKGLYNLQIMAEHYDILQAGTTHCGAEWGRRRGPYACYMIYHLLAGRCRVEIARRTYTLTAGSVYFFSGYALTGHSCQSMHVRWIHLLPTSFTLIHALRQAPPIHRWRQTLLGDTCGRLEFEMLGPHGQPALPLTAHFALHSFVQELLSRVTQRLAPADPADADLIRKLGPAIEFMDRHYVQAPSLDSIAQTVSLAANYFHALFRQCSGLSPYQYMLHKRMSLAQHLLLTSDQPVKQIAQRVGYACPFHFAKVFRRYFRQSPSQCRVRNVPGGQ
jgi:AraC-like DNA-binding protein